MSIMKADYALILAAGLGTRMGEIGRKIPKVLWPVFEKTILELEVAYARNLGIEKIFINSHYFTKEIKEHFSKSRDFDGVILLEEKEKIDIGGAIHNMAKQVNYKGLLLVLNSDQFLMLEDSVWKEAFKKIEVFDHLLFSYNVNTNDKYNALIESEGKLTSVELYQNLPTNYEIQTYTGMSLIRLEKLPKVEGKSNFFESVANYSSANIALQNIQGSHYWDFGTLDRYWKSMFEILKKFNDQDQFIKLLINTHAVKTDKVKENSYNSTAPMCINLSQNSMNISNSIILASDSLETYENKNKIIWNDLVYYF